MSAAQLLLIEDELQLAEAMKISLKKMGYSVVWVSSLQEAKAALHQTAAKKFDLWILDRNLPDGDGLSLLADPGAGTARVLVLSSKSSVQDRVQGLTKGADDYLPKPFHLEELKARLQVLLKRVNTEEPVVATTELPLWSLKPENLQVNTLTGWQELTALEFKVLSYLIAREDEIISKDRLLRDVWGFTFLPKTRTVDYVLTQLRKRIEADPNRPQHLLTVRGVGLKWVGGRK